MGERILGVVGGVGPESTLDYYRRLLDGYHARVGPLSHPPLLIDSLDGGLIIPRLIAGDLDPVRAAVAHAVEQLAAGGASLALVASVATHAVYDDVAPRAPIPMLSIVEATCRAAVAAGIRRPALFGTRVAVEAAYFARPFDAAGVTLVRPAEPDRTWIHDAYIGELVQGVFRDETRSRLLEILAVLAKTDGARAQRRRHPRRRGHRLAHRHGRGRDGLDEGPAKRVRPRVVDADADQAADQIRRPCDVHELALA
jgi:aspartate racemase